jgi:hypothetical protein
MGAMGFGPIESDSAADWVAKHVAAPLFDAIQTTLQAYLGETEAVSEEEAEVAAAVLVDCTSSATVTKYGTITNSTTSEAIRRDLWILAIAAIDNSLRSAGRRNGTIPKRSSPCSPNSGRISKAAIRRLKASERTSDDMAVSRAGAR